MTTATSAPVTASGGHTASRRSVTCVLSQRPTSSGASERIQFLTGDRLALFSLVLADAWQWTPFVMLVMFAAGVANLWWMAALGAVMFYEKAGRFGDRLTPVVGVALLGLAGLVVVHHGLPVFGSS